MTLRHLIERYRNVAILALCLVPLTSLVVPAQELPPTPDCTFAAPTWICEALADSAAAAAASARDSTRSTPLVLWTNFNHGAGSGLDADLLDGVSSETILGEVDELREKVDAPKTAFKVRTVAYEWIKGSDYSKLTFPKVEFDRLGEWDADAQKFVAKEAGIYQFHAFLHFANHNFAGSAQAFFAKNGAPDWDARRTINLPYNTNVWEDVTSLVMLEAGDSVELVLWAEPARQAGAGISFLEAHRVG